ncbi:unnamed protein product [Rotaria sp. Silwood1]|nr:unnamed protein product [Rotaria sp. Silwood1]
MNTIQQEIPIIYLSTQKLHQYSSQTISTISSFDMQQDALTNNTTMRTSYSTQLSPISPTHNDNHSSLDHTTDSSTTVPHNQFSVSQIIQTSHHYQPLNSSLNLSNNKHRRSKSYEDDLHINKRTKGDSFVEDTQLNILNLEKTSLLSERFITMATNNKSLICTNNQIKQRVSQ